MLFFKLGNLQNYPGNILKYSLSKQNNVEFEYIDIDKCSSENKNKGRQDIQNRGGRLVYPTIIIDDKILLNGAPQDKLREVLEI